MLKLGYLFDNRDRTMSILSRWDYDQDQLHLLDYFRISANAVYPFKHNGVLHFLRFAPQGEKEEQQIRAELEFLHYLRAHGYPCLVLVKSRLGNELEVVELPQGTCYATAFVGVPGKNLSSQTTGPDILYAWGKAMGRLHRLSMDYRPVNYLRHSHEDKLQWMEQLLLSFPEENAARKELSIISDWLSSLPKTPEVYGLIHYDFETDNIFYDPETHALSVIDFDDAVYHWFAMDITTALESYEGESPELAREQFIAGYRSEHVLEDYYLELLPVFKRYKDLYGFVRILRSASDSGFGEEPEWMVNLRSRFAASCEHRRSQFGRPM